MTGTASEVFDCNNEVTRRPSNSKFSNGRSSNLELLSDWIFGRIDADCILNDISECGASILLPKNYPIPTSTFKLIVMSPENDKQVHCMLRARLRWQNNEFTQAYKKVGAEFLDITHELRGEINVLKPFFYNDSHQQIKCRVVKP